MDPRVKEHWGQPFRLKADLGDKTAVVIKDCVVDRMRLLELLNGPVFFGDNPNGIAACICEWVAESMRVALGGEKEFNAWKKRNLPRGTAFAPVSRSQIDGCMKKPTGGDFTWDARVVYSIYRSTAQDVSKDQVFRPKFISTMRSYHVDFASITAPVNDDSTPHRHAIYPQNLGIHRTPLNVVFPEMPSGGKTQPEPFSFALAIAAAQLSILWPRSTYFEPGDFSMLATEIRSESFEFSPVRGPSTAMRTWNIVPPFDASKPEIRPINGGIVSYDDAPSAPWFHLVVRSPQMALAFRLTASIADITKPQLQLGGDGTHGVLDLLRLAFIAEDLRPDLAVPEGDIPLASSELILSGPTSYMPLNEEP